MSTPQVRSAGWAPFDPNLYRDWSHRPMVATPLILVYALFALCSPWFAVVVNPNATQQLHTSIPTSFWQAAMVVGLGMTFGNASVLLPKLLLAVGCAGVLVAIVGAQVFEASVSSLIGSVALLLWCVPPPSGPLANANADVGDLDELPPMNLGLVFVRCTGGVLAVVAFTL